MSPKKAAKKAVVVETSPMDRADLLALTPDALAALSSRGLVKRAQRMLETGLEPQVELAEDGTVIGHFELRNVVCKLLPGKTLAGARCGCGAIGVCYHGIATVLWFQRGDIAPGEDSADKTVENWSPGEFEDKAISTFVKKLGMARARRILAGGLVVKVGFEDGEPVARLPSCTLRFLVPHDLAYARCDCEIGVGCEHIPIAVWAFRQAGDIPPDGPGATVELAATGEIDLAPTKLARDVALDVLWTGVASTPEAAKAQFERARKALGEGNQVWPLALIDELEAAVNQYRARSARYRPATASTLVSSLEARWRSASRSEVALPSSVVLGTTESAETRLSELRLMSLGARAIEEHSYDVYLVDADTANVFVLRVGRRGLAGASTRDIACGQLVTQAGRRRANRQLTLSSSGGGKTAVAGKAGDFSTLKAPLMVSDINAFATAWALRPPALLRPRVLAENVVVLPVEEVCDARWSPGDQALAAEVVLPDQGGTVSLVRRYRAAAEGAIPALAKAFADGGKDITYMTGEVRRTAAGFEIDPLALMTPAGLLVPDLEPSQAFEAELGDLETTQGALSALLDEVLGVMDDGVHRGLLGSPLAWVERLGEASQKLRGHGLAGLAELLKTFAGSVQAVRDGGRSAQPQAADRWLDAYIALSVAREQVRA